ncbi:MAG: hypothetical protein FJZ79_08225 [Chlorobi bacterium]|nr:hypothetical protein [Chlorobiota bacterium]
MATISLYVSGQTELNDVTEFFQKNLMNARENPVAFFDGVFYESHQERVGNIVFQDYLVYTDKAVYLWARGANKDYLDRFNLGSVSVNSRNKDSDFATLNLKIRREEKEPVYVIFDMVEIQEAELITRLHTVIESAIEDVLGVNYRKEIPDPVAARVLHAARNICPFQPFSISIPEGPAVHQDSSIGYGQDLLEQYKASIGYGQEEQASPAQHVHNPAAEAMRGLENILPADPAALKRIASSIKDIVGDAPFKLRDQVMKDLQHVPGDVATVLTALNELLANIAGNPQAERFVMTAITTAVRNDGVLGSIGKMLKLTTGFGSGGGRKQAPKHASGSDRHSRDDDALHAKRPSFDDDDASTIRRKKISIKDDSLQDGSGMFAGEMPEDERLPLPGERRRKDDLADDDADRGIKRKKISIKADESEASALVRDMMAMDTSPADAASAPVREEPPAAADKPVATTEVRHKKIKIVADAADASDEPGRTQEEPESEPLHPAEEAGESPVRRKIIAIVADAPAEEEMGVSEEDLAGALGEASAGGGSAGVYTTIESDSEQSVAGEKTEESDNSGTGQKTGEYGEQSMKRTIKVKSTQ